MAIDESLKKLDKIFDQNIEITGTLTVGGSEIDFSSYLTSIPSEYLTQTEGDARYLQSFTIPSEYLTQTEGDARYLQSFTVPEEYLTQTEGDARYLQSYTLPSPLSKFSDSAWAGGSGYPGYTFVGGNSRFGFSSTSGVVDMYIDGNYYATDSKHLVIHAGNIGSQSVSYATSAGSAASATSATSAGTVSGTQLGADAQGLTAFTTPTHWSKPAGYQTMIRADQTSGDPGGQSYYGYMITSRRDTGTGYSALLTGYANNDFWITYNNTETNNPTWRRIWTDINDGSGSGLDADLLDGIQGSQFLRSDASDTGSGEYTFTNKRHYFGQGTSWDSVGTGSQTNVHFQGHDQFWVGAGNGTWFTGTANSKSATSGLSADAGFAHDLLITTMQSTSSADRGITFAVDNAGNGNSGWRLGKWHSGDAYDSSKLTVDGGLFVKGGYADEFEYYGDDYSQYYSSQGGASNWSGDTNAGWHSPSITASSAIQIQSGNNGSNSRKPQLQFHQYGYGGPAIEYDGPNKTMWIGDINSSTGDRMRYLKFRFGVVDAGLSFNHDQMWREGGPLHIQHSSGYNTYINCSSGGNVGIGADSAADKLEVHGNVRANAFYDTNTAYYLNPGSDATSINVRGVIQNPSIWINDGDNYNGYNESIRLFNPVNNGPSVIAFAATGTSGTPTSSILGYSDRHEVRRGDNWETRTYDGYQVARGSYRAPVFYDSDNTSYYVNPTGTSFLNGDLNISSGYLTVAKGHSDTRLQLLYDHSSDSGDAQLLLWGSEPGITYYGAGIGANINFSGQYYGRRTSAINYGLYMRFEPNNGNIYFNDTTGTPGTNGGQGNTNFQIDPSGNTYSFGSSRSPIFYDYNNTNRYLDPTSDSLISGTLNISGNTGGSSYGNQLVLGQESKNLPYTKQDTNVRPIIYSTGKYPVLTLNHTVTTNTNHGPTIQFSHNGANNNSQWVAGTNGTGSQFQIGFSNTGLGNSDFNPHNGIAGYNGVTALHIDDSYRIGIGANGDWGGLGGGNPVANIHLKAPQTYSSYGAFRGTVIQSDQNGGGKNGSGLLVVNENGNHSWGVVAEFRVNNNTIGADRSSIAFTTSAYSGQSWTLGYAHNSGSNFRIKRDHGWVSQSWGTTLMEMDRNGNVTFTGDVVAYSDERLKKDIKTIEKPLDTVKQLRGVTYKLKENDKESIGLIAQEVEKVLPQVVLETEGDVDAEFAPKGVAYGNIVGVLIEAVKELSNKVEELENKLNGSIGTKA